MVHNKMYVISKHPLLDSSYQNFDNQIMKKFPKIQWIIFFTEKFQSNDQSNSEINSNFFRNLSGFWRGFIKIKLNGPFQLDGFWFFLVKHDRVLFS
jgi:hypothetical protein